MPCTAWMKVSVQGISDGHKIKYMHLRICPMAYIIVKESMLDDGVVVWKEEGAGRIIVQSRKERMVYKEFQDFKISALGMGAMRL